MMGSGTAMALARARTGVAPEAEAVLGVKILLLQDEAAAREMEAKTLPKMRTAAIAVHRTRMPPRPAAAAEVEPRRTGGSALAAS